VRGIVLVASFSAGLVLLNSLSLAIIAMSVCCMAMTFVYDIPHASRISSLRPHIDRSEVWGLLKGCLPLVISTFLMSSIVSVARQWFSNSYGTEALGLYAAVATPAVLVQAAARYLYAPALVPLSEKWRDEPRDFVTSFAKTAKIMLVACVGMVIVFSLIGGPVLKLVYGESIADYTYLFPLVLVGTALLAFGWFLSDVLVLCRSLYGMLCEAGIAMAAALVVMIPLETMYGMDGINYTVIVAASSGVMAALLCIRHAYRKTLQQSR
jgi:O-antigen/teichoic acid export membrane protein